MDTIETRLASMNILLPSADGPRGRYRPAVCNGNQIWLSGQGPIEDGRVVYTGRLGEDVTSEEGRAAARLSTINLLAQLKRACGGSLERVSRCIFLTVYVSSSVDFFSQPLVADGATELLAQLWGDDNLPARSAVGVFALPMNIPVEVDAVFEIY